MNYNERKALLSFLSIYVGSAIFLIGILLYVYYKDEMANVEKTCSMELSNASMNIKAEILNSYMHYKTYVPQKLSKDAIRYALYDKNQKLIFSYLDGAEFVKLDNKFYEDSHYHFFVEELNEPDIPIKYIVMETCVGVQDRNNLKVYVLVALVLSAIFVGFVGYLLAKLLLKPVREKVEHMDKFIKDSAHELNTPISVLMTSVSMLKKGKKPEKMMKYILSSSKQISQLYNDIHFSAFDDIHESVIEEFALDELVCDSVEYFGDIAVTKNIKIKSDVDSCFIKMDKTKTTKIVNNLISNAVKYSHQNSEIIVGIKNNVFFVEDYGIGINEKDQKEIFKRFKRGNNIEGGFGIGLDIVKRICLEYDLNFGLKSVENEGSTFSIDFSNITVKK